MYRIVLVCYGVPKSAGAEAATDITAEFLQHHPWHSNAICTWDGERLMLQADNDYDPEGLALLDEFSDNIAAFISDLFDGEIKVESITQVQTGA